MFYKLIFVIIAGILGILINKWLIKKQLIVTSEVHKCPYCFGTSYCNSISNNAFTYEINDLKDIFNNYFSVKNVYKGYINKKSVVVKKLGHDSELNDLDKHICSMNNLNSNCDLNKINDDSSYENKIFTFLSEESDGVKSLKTCNHDVIRKVIVTYANHVKCDNENNCLKHLWTVLQINPEPIILMLLDDFKVPQLYGACGRLVVVENAGRSLHFFLWRDWIERAYLALQILEAAEAFTENHEDFRFYLTDVSPDNIAVDDDLNLRFVDFENVILSSKSTNSTIEHYSEDVGQFEFAYSEKNICNSFRSDHNYYAVCKLLLSVNSPRPMVDQGLLHSPPNYIKEEYPELFLNIENCVKLKFHRFDIIRRLIETLEEILAGYKL